MPDDELEPSIFISFLLLVIKVCQPCRATGGGGLNLVLPCKV